MKPFCINTTSGIALENCGFDWADTVWCAGFRRNANPYAMECVEGLPMSYLIATDNATYVNVTFATTMSGGAKFYIDYNLTQNAHFIDITPTFKTPNNVPSNTTARFSIIQRNININDTVENNTAWFDNVNYSLQPNTTTDNVANTSVSNTFVLYRWDDREQIIYGWSSPYKTKLDVWPQANYPNRQTNLTFEVGLIASSTTYKVPLKWQDLEIDCDVGTSVMSVIVSRNSTNLTSTNQYRTTATALKVNNGECTFYLYYKSGSGKYALMPSSFTTASITLPVGRTAGANTSQVSTSSPSVTWDVEVGGMNSTTSPLGNLSTWINISGVSDGDIAGYLKYATIWDTKPTNATVNTSNWTNYTQGNIFIHIWGADETNLRVLELYSNESGTWKYTDKQNASTNSINKSFIFNFTRTFSNTQTVCYLYGITAKDTTYDTYTNKWNVTNNVTLCVNLTIIAPGVVSRTIQYAKPVWRTQDEDAEVIAVRFDNWYFLLAICFGVGLTALFVRKKDN